MKKLAVAAVTIIFCACNVSVNENDGNASDTTKLDTILDKIDTTIDKGVDSLKAGFHRITDSDKKDTTKK